MRMKTVIAFGLLLLGVASPSSAANELAGVEQRFASLTDEIPSFQKHVSPLFGRLGCNGRSCHGSFQGRGGFQLSLFGYDFQADHKALTDGEKPRVDKANPLASLILVKPTDADMHEGGERYAKDSWQHHVFRRWIEAGAKFEADEQQRIVRLEVSPSELLFSKAGDVSQLRAVAVWPDGVREDVTSLCRFQSNSDQIATIDANGVVTAAEPGDTHVVVFYDSAVVAVPVLRPVSDRVGSNYPASATPTKIDEHVASKLSKLGIVPSEICSDSDFLRRVSLDLTGTLPTAAEAEAFLADTSPQKRQTKVEQLLATPAYAAWWTTKFCDWTGNNDRQLNNIGVRGAPVQEWYDWIYKRVADNTPYDQFAADIVLATSRKPDQSYTDYCAEMSAIYHKDAATSFAERDTMPYYWARQNMRQPEEKAIGFAYTFLGIRIQCAQCHKHPFDQWSKDDFDAFKNFFTRVTTARTGLPGAKKEYDELLTALELKGMKGNDLQKKLPVMLKEGKTVPFMEVGLTPPKRQAVAKGKGKRKGKQNERQPAPATARVLGGEEVDFNGLADPRQPLMDWLRSKDNPYFAKAVVNRVWANYFNVGIVQPADDLSLANPPSNAALLDYLTNSFIEHNYDMKWLHHEITLSDTYQRTWQPNETNAKDERNFSRAVPRRLPAEAAYDATISATASDAKAAEMLTNLKGRAISVPAASTRNAGNGAASFALQVFGRSIRESNCDCDRSADASLLQTVYLRNDTSVLAAINGGKETWIDQLSRKPNTKLADGGDAAKLNIDQELKRLNRRLERVRKDNASDADAQIGRIELRIADLKRAKQERDEIKPGAIQLPPDEVIRQAYLRTLTRLPTADEMNRCRVYLAHADTPVDGAKGLLWTLLNTKEFIVNH